MIINERSVPLLNCDEILALLLLAGFLYLFFEVLAILNVLAVAKHLNAARCRPLGAQVERIAQHKLIGIPEGSCLQPITADQQSGDPWVIAEIDSSQLILPAADMDEVHIIPQIQLPAPIGVNAQE